MSLSFNLRHLEDKNLRLRGQLPAAELELDGLDEVIRAREPLDFDVEVQRLDDSVLVQGRLRLGLNCECVRCLKSFRYEIELDPWVCHIPLEGEEKAVVVNDLVDLTPYVREDIVLAFPQHPLCEPECSGLAPMQRKSLETSAGAGVPASPWAALDKLKL